MNQMRAVVVDDHPLMRFALKVKLQSCGAEVIASAATVAQGTELLSREDYDVAIVDLSLPDGSGRDLIGSLSRGKREKVLAVTAQPAARQAAELISLGCGGYVSKNVDTVTFCDFTQRVRAGERVIDPGLASDVLGRLTNPGRYPSLTEREDAVLQAIAGGVTKNRDIAELLCCAESTVRTHVDRMYTKFGVNDRAMLLIAALHEGFLHHRSTVAALA